MGRHVYKFDVRSQGDVDSWHASAQRHNAACLVPTLHDEPAELCIGGHPDYRPPGARRSAAVSAWATSLPVFLSHPTRLWSTFVQTLSWPLVAYLPWAFRHPFKVPSPPLLSSHPNELKAHQPLIPPSATTTTTYHHRPRPQTTTIQPGQISQRERGDRERDRRGSTILRELLFMFTVVVRVVVLLPHICFRRATVAVHTCSLYYAVHNCDLRHGDGR